MLDISSLTSEGEDGDTDTELRRAVGRVPGAARLELVATRCSHNCVVRHLLDIRVSGSPAPASTPR